MKVSQSELSIDNVLTVNKRQGNMCICCWSCDPLSASHSSALSMIKYKKLISLQRSVRAIESHIQNSTNHFLG